MSCTKHATTRLVTDLRGKEISGRKIVNVVGAGNIGLVYSARHIVLGRQEAVKVIFDAQGNAIQRFHQEANVLSRLRDPHTVRIFDFLEVPGDVGAIACLFMEFVNGSTLTRAAANRRFDLPVASRVIYQVCQALGEAHAEGIVHRDIKPGNIMLARDKQGRESVRVLDFGLAKMVMVGVTGSNQEPTQEELTQAGQIVGTIAYMAPEQIRSTDLISPATDIYSLGLVYHWLLTGSNPMKDESGNHWSTMQNQIFKPLPHLDPNDFPSAIVDLIGRMTAKEPEDRPKTVDEIQRELVEHGRIDTKDGPVLRPSPRRGFRPEDSDGNGSSSGGSGRMGRSRSLERGYTETFGPRHRSDRLLIALLSLVIVLLIAVVGGVLLFLRTDRLPIPVAEPRAPAPVGAPRPAVSLPQPSAPTRAPAAPAVLPERGTARAARGEVATPIPAAIEPAKPAPPLTIKPKVSAPPASQPAREVKPVPRPARVGRAAAPARAERATSRQSPTATAGLPSPASPPVEPQPSAAPAPKQPATASPFAEKTSPFATTKKSPFEKADEKSPFAGSQIDSPFEGGETDSPVEKDNDSSPFGENR